MPKIFGVEQFWPTLVYFKGLFKENRKFDYKSWREIWISYYKQNFWSLWSVPVLYAQYWKTFSIYWLWFNEEKENTSNTIKRSWSK